MSGRPTLSVKNFDEFQHYRDRTPPWIKLYNRILDDYEFGELPDASKWHLVAIWLLASRSNNCIPHDAAWISKRISAKKQIDLRPLIDSGFLVENQALQHVEHDASKPLDLARSREGETEGEGETEKEVVNANGVDSPERFPIVKAFENWNLIAQELGLPVADKLTAERRRKLRARLSEHGIDGWNRALKNIADSDFLLGKNGRDWRASLDFMLQPTSFVKVLEGQYGNRNPE